MHPRDGLFNGQVWILELALSSYLLIQRRRVRNWLVQHSALVFWYASPAERFIVVYAEHFNILFMPCANSPLWRQLVHMTVHLVWHHLRLTWLTVLHLFAHYNFNAQGQSILSKNKNISFPALSQNSFRIKSQITSKMPQSNFCAWIIAMLLEASWNIYKQN